MWIDTPLQTARKEERAQRPTRLGSPRGLAQKETWPSSPRACAVTVHGHGPRCTCGLPGEPPRRVPWGWRATQSHSTNTCHSEDSRGVHRPAWRQPPSPRTSMGGSLRPPVRMLERGASGRGWRGVLSGPVHEFLQQSCEHVPMAAAPVTDGSTLQAGRLRLAAQESTHPGTGLRGAGLCPARVKGQTGGVETRGAGGGVSERGTP